MVYLNKDMDKEEIRKDKIVEEWMYCWNEQKFPIGLTVAPTYLEWREFREFWIEQCPGMELLNAYQAYILINKENDKDITTE